MGETNCAKDNSADWATQIAQNGTALTGGHKFAQKMKALNGRNKLRNREQR